MDVFPAGILFKIESPKSALYESYLNIKSSRKERKKVQRAAWCGGAGGRVGREVICLLSLFSCRWCMLEEAGIYGLYVNIRATILPFFCLLETHLATRSPKCRA